MMLKDLVHIRDEKLTIETLSNMHAKDIADQIKDFNKEEIDYLTQLLEYDKQIEVFSYLPLEEAANYLLTESLEEQVSVINSLEPDDARDVLLAINPEERKEIFDSLDKNSKVLELLNYDEDDAGSYMTNLFIKVNISDSIKQATKKVIQQASEVNNFSIIYVVNDQLEYMGQLTLIDLIKAKPENKLQEFIKIEETFLDTDDIYELAEHIKYYQLKEVPIKNENNNLIGIVTFDDILDLLEDDFQDDFEAMMALPEQDPDDSVIKSSLNRIPWLSVLLLMAIPLAYLTSFFEATIAGAVILAMFQPLILDAGGNVATQTLAVSLITIDDKENTFIKNGIKEITSGIITSLLMSVFAFLMTYVVAYVLKSNQGFLTAIIVSVSLFISVIAGSVLGFIVPLFLNKFKIDPVVASGPLITTLIDIISLLVYFGLATILLGGQL